MRDDDEPSGTLPPLTPNSHYSEEHSSVEDELVAHVSCDNPLLKDNNAKVCYYLEEATRSTQHEASIKLYQKKKNRRDVCLSLIQNMLERIKESKILSKQISLFTISVGKGKVTALCISSVANTETPALLCNNVRSMQTISF